MKTDCPLITGLTAGTAGDAIERKAGRVDFDFQIPGFGIGRAFNQGSRFAGGDAITAEITATICEVDFGVTASTYINKSLGARRDAIVTTIALLDKEMFFNCPRRTQGEVLPLEITT